MADIAMMRSRKPTTLQEARHWINELIRHIEALEAAASPPAQITYGGPGHTTSGDPLPDDAPTA